MGKYANAACGMLHWLHEQGIEAGPVSQPSKKDPVVVVWGLDAADVAKLPATFDGFAVEGKAEKFDYQRGRPHEMIPVNRDGSI